MKSIIVILLSLSLSMADVYKDEETGLVWQDNKDATMLQMDWNEANEYCENLVLGGYSDWLLPNTNELSTIFETNRKEPFIKKEFQHVLSDNYYWTASTVALHSNKHKYAWAVNFSNLDYDDETKVGNNMYVRCVSKGKHDTPKLQDLITQYTKEEYEKSSKPPKILEVVRDEFETTLQFKQRVAATEKKYEEDIAKYKENAGNINANVQAKAVGRVLEVTWGKPILSNLHYDADNGYFVADVTFEVKKDVNKKVAIRVPLEKARAFKKEFDALRPKAIFDYDGKNVKLKDIRVPYEDKLLVAQFTDVNLDSTMMAVNLTGDVAGTAFAGAVNVSDNNVNSFDTSKLNNFNELDELLENSQAVEQDKTKWLFVVGIEQYEYTDNISYAKRSAEMFVKTAQKRLGVPQENSYVMINNGATTTKIKTNMKKLLRRVQKGDSIYFYYNGHGVPVPSLKNEPFMLTADTEPDFIADEEFFSLKNIYAKLSNSKADKVVAVVDSCFSGVTDGKAVLKGVAATKMVAKSVSFNKEKMVVLSAGKVHQYSNGYDKKAYRLFSFYIMKNIINGDTDIKTLFKNTKTQTYNTSMQEYGDSRTQEPTVDGNFRLSL